MGHFRVLTARQVRCENGSWFNHVLEWWEAAKADPEHVLFLHYENMLRNPEEHIRLIADFAGIEHTPEIIAKVRSLPVSSDVVVGTYVILAAAMDACFFIRCVSPSRFLQQLIMRRPPSVLATGIGGTWNVLLFFIKMSFCCWHDSRGNQRFVIPRSMDTMYEHAFISCCDRKLEILYDTSKSTDVW